MRVIKAEAGRRVAFLIAAKSMDRGFVGTMAKLMGAVSVRRGMDETKSAPGKVYLPDPDNNPTLIRGVDTNFQDALFQVGGLLVLPKVKGEAANTEISEIISATELRLKKPFKTNVALNQLTGRVRVIPDGSAEADQPQEFEGTPFRIAPKIDQKEVYQKVADALGQGGCVGMFPEGGSHDRSELLPLKGMLLSSFIGNRGLIVSSRCRYYGTGNNEAIPRVWAQGGTSWAKLLSRT
jgi:glycerol-3-phosphate O-acyltransferase/dihydroxyacetone phosphate acyltransferase